MEAVRDPAFDRAGRGTFCPRRRRRRTSPAAAARARHLQRAGRDQHRHRDRRYRAGRRGDGRSAARGRSSPRRDVQVLLARAAQGQSGGAVARHAAHASRSCCSRISTSCRRTARTGRSIPFKLTEQDGYFYGRGTATTNTWRPPSSPTSSATRQEGYKPDRDIILALETDEEILDRDGLGIQWLLKNHRDLIDAEFALNEGGGVGMKDGKPIRNSVQTSEKVSLSYPARGEEPRRPQLGADARTTRSIIWPKAWCGWRNSASR